MRKTLFRLLTAVLLIGALVGVLASCGNEDTDLTVRIMDGDTEIKTLTFAPEAAFTYDKTSLAKTGYDFVGLYTDKELTTEFKAAEGETLTISESMTLYAKYTVKSFFLLVDGTTRVDVTYGGAYSLEPPIREGYRFREFTYMGETFPASGTFTYTQSLPITTTWDRIVKINIFDGTTKITSVEVATDGSYILPAVTATKAGYTFDAYMNGSTAFGTKQEDGTYTGSYTGTEDIDLFYSWTPVATYAMTVNGLYGDDAVAPASYKTGDTFTLPIAPTRDGYIFTGYTVNGEALTLTDGSATFTWSENVTVTANWHRIATIHVNSNAEKITSVTVGTDGSFTLPAVSDTATHIFGGYTLDGITLTKQSDGTYTGIYTGEEDLTAYQIWTVIPTYTLTVNGLYGDDAVAPTSYKTGDTFTLPTAPTRDGYIFAGYTVNGEALTLTNGSATFTWSENTTITANWTARVYITVRDEITNTVLGAVEVVNGAYDLSAYIPAEEDRVVEDNENIYTYVGFVLDGSSFAVVANDYTGGSVTVTRDWDGVHRIFIDVVSVGATYVFPSTEIEGGAYTPIATPSLTGYYFLGFYTDSACTQAFDNDGATDATADVTVYAKWRRIATVNINNGPVNVGSVTVAEDGSFTLPAVSDTTTHIFDGYTLDGITLTKQPDGTYTGIYTGDSNVTAYQVFTAIPTYMLTVSGLYGTDAIVPASYKTGDAFTLPTAPTRDGFRFIGYTVNGVALTLTDGSATFIWSENTTVTANWAPVYKIQFYNGNLYLGEATVDEGGNVTFEGLDDTDSHLFAGYTMSGASFARNQDGTWTATGVSANGTAFASWTQLPKVNLNVNGGAPLAEDSMYLKPGVNTLPIPTRDGFTFAGWTLGGAAFGAKEGESYVYTYTTWEGAMEVTLVATWIDASSLGEVTGKEYFRELDSTGEIIYIFLTGNTYNFSGYTLSIRNNDGVVTLNDSSNGFVANKVGSFTMTMTAADGSTREVFCRVQTKLTAVDVGSATAGRNEANFKDGISEELDVGMENFIPDLRVTGVKGDGTADSNILFTDIPYSISIRVYDDATSTWISYEGFEVTEGVIDKGYEIANGTISFTDTALCNRKIELTIDPDYDLGTSCSRTMILRLNDGVNVYTNDELYTAYSNTAVTKINVLRNITAVMQDEHCAHGHVTGCICGEAYDKAGSAENPIPVNDYEHGVYTRVYTRYGQPLTVNGNHYTIDGSKLPKIDGRNPASAYDGLFEGAGYSAVNVQIGLFSCYAKYDTAAAGAKSPEVTFNDLYLIGNYDGDSTSTVSSTTSAEGSLELILGSMSFDGFVVRSGYLTLNNTTMYRMNKGVHSTGFASAPYKNSKDENVSHTPLRLETQVILNSVKVEDSYSNAFFAWGQVQTELNNCEIGQCAGPAIVFSDTDISATAYANGVGSKLTFGTGTTVKNYVTGNEAWFLSYGVTNTAQLKSMIDSTLGGSAMSTNKLENGEYFNLVLAVNSASDTRFPGSYGNDANNVSGADHYGAPCIDLVFEDTAFPTTNGITPFPIQGNTTAFPFVGANSYNSEYLLTVDPLQAGMQLLIQLFAPRS